MLYFKHSSLKSTIREIALSANGNFCENNPFILGYFDRLIMSVHLNNDALLATIDLEIGCNN